MCVIGLTNHDNEDDVDDSNENKVWNIRFLACLD